jgi:hypothetical protein
MFVSDSRSDGGPSRLAPRDVLTLPFVDGNVRESSLSDHLAVA